MRCTVTTLRKNGLRLKKSEWPEPVAGELEMGWWDADTNSSKRDLRLLTLYEFYGKAKRPALTLFEPTLLDVVDDGLVFAGYDQDSGDGRVREHRQLWLVTPGGVKSTAPR